MIQPTVPSLYAPASLTTAVVRLGEDYRRNRIAAADMISIDDASKLTGTNLVTINAWIKRGCVIGVENLRQEFKLPQWQFEPLILQLVEPIANCLGTNDGWQLLNFFRNTLSFAKRADASRGDRARRSGGANPRRGNS